MGIDPQLYYSDSFKELRWEEAGCGCCGSSWKVKDEEKEIADYIKVLEAEIQRWKDYLENKKPLGS